MDVEPSAHQQAAAIRIQSVWRTALVHRHVRYIGLERCMRDVAQSNIDAWQHEAPHLSQQQWAGIEGQLKPASENKDDPATAHVGYVFARGGLRNEIRKIFVNAANAATWLRRSFTRPRRRDEPPPPAAQEVKRSHAELMCSLALSRRQAHAQ